MQCKRAMLFAPPISASTVLRRFSGTVAAPTDSTTGLPVRATRRSNGVFVISADAILKNGTSGLSMSTAPSSNGVEMNSIPTFLQCSARTSYSDAPNASYFLKSSYWLSVASFVVSQYAGECREASVSALYVWNFAASAPLRLASSTRRFASSIRAFVIDADFGYDVRCRIGVNPSRSKLDTGFAPPRATVGVMFTTGAFLADAVAHGAPSIPRRS